MEIVFLYFIKYFISYTCLVGWICLMFMSDNNNIFVLFLKIFLPVIICYSFFCTKISENNDVSIIIVEPLPIYTPPYIPPYSEE
jgi:hypothetical protein